MDKKRSQELVERAEQHIEEDRKKLLDLYTKLVATVNQKTESDELLFHMSSISEQLVRITDSMTKQTCQLVEMAKITQKSELARTKGKGDDEFDDDEQEAMFREITGS